MHIASLDMFMVITILAIRERLNDYCSSVFSGSLFVFSYKAMWGER